jgi:hypothetical protein
LRATEAAFLATVFFRAAALRLATAVRALRFAAVFGFAEPAAARRAAPFFAAAFFRPAGRALTDRATARFLLLVAAPFRFAITRFLS